MEWHTDNHWEFAVRTCADRLTDFGGKTARFDSRRTDRTHHWHYGCQMPC